MSEELVGMHEEVSRAESNLFEAQNQVLDSYEQVN
jgi:hypothetical protein